MENNSSDIESVYKRLKSYLEKLERLIAEIVEELESNRKERSDWFEWHEDWKNAWLGNEGNVLFSDNSAENRRFITSVKRRNSLLDLKKEVHDLQNELEEIRCDREKLLLFLERDIFQN